MERLGEVLQEHPLADGEYVLALTFMHGSRHRLDERLRQMQSTVRFAFDCLTIDSFAYRIVRRWSALVTALGIPPIVSDDYDTQCDVAAQLLERDNVRSWVVARYPVIVVDEAQDLAPERLRMVQGLTVLATTLAAADEFQCLEPKLWPSQAVEWLHDASCPEVLSGSRRTSNAGVLAAAAALRTGSPIMSGAHFRVLAGRFVNFAAATIAGQICRNPGQSIAVITPSRAKFVVDTVTRVASVPCGKAKLGPYPLKWEDAQDDVVREIRAALHLEETNTYENLMDLLQEHRDKWVARDVTAWIRRQRATLGRQSFAAAEIEAAIKRVVRNAMRYARTTRRGLYAMTTHQAKNREFDGVIVIWPYAVKKDPEQRRRLLYNAVTRAKSWCTVIVEGEKVQGVPFVYE